MTIKTAGTQRWGLWIIMLSLVHTGTRLLSQHISLWFWPAVVTRPLALLTVRAHFEPSPLSCPTDRTTLRPVQWVAPRLNPSLLLPSPHGGVKPLKLRISFELNVSSVSVSSDCLGLVLGGGLVKFPLNSCQRRWAPDRTELLSRQDISGGDATAQDVSTYSLTKRH